MYHSGNRERYRNMKSQDDRIGGLETGVDIRRSKRQQRAVFVRPKWNDGDYTECHREPKPIFRYVVPATNHCKCGCAASDVKCKPLPATFFIEFRLVEVVVTMQ